MQRIFPVGWRYTHYLLSVLGIGCALLLIVLSLNGRTVWTPGVVPISDVVTVPDDWPLAGSIRVAAGWDWLARGAGVITIIALGIGLYTSRRWLVIACTATASVFLAWAAYVAWQFSTDIAKGLIVRDGWTAHPPEHVGTAAQVAVLASALALLLLVGNIISGPQKDRPTTQP